MRAGGGTGSQTALVLVVKGDPHAVLRVPNGRLRGLVSVRLGACTQACHLTWEGWHLAAAPNMPKK